MLTMNNKNIHLDSVEQDAETTVSDKSYGIYFGILAVTLILLALLPWEASWVETRRGWYTQPMFGSALGLIIVALFAAVRVIDALRHNLIQKLNPAEMLAEFFSSYRVALFSSALFFLYINTLSIFGFFLASLIFISTLLWLSRLFNRTWFIASLCTLIAMVLIFRVGVSVWMPDVWLYGLLPDSWSDFANQYL